MYRNLLHRRPGQRHLEVFPFLPAVELIRIVRRAWLAGLAGGIDGAKDGFAEVGNQPIASAADGLPVGAGAGIADGVGIAPQWNAAVIEQFSQFAAIREDVLEV